MAVLQLAVRRKWFELIKSGEKTELEFAWNGMQITSIRSEEFGEALVPVYAIDLTTLLTGE